MWRKSSWSEGHTLTLMAADMVCNPSILVIPLEQSRYSECKSKALLERVLGDVLF